MTKRDRVLAALEGESVDRVPIGFWMHNFATENSAAGLAEETRRLARRFDWDYLKPQSRAQCFAEMWGLRYAPSGARAVPYTVTHTPLASGTDLKRITPVDPTTGALGEQLEALRMIRAAVGADTPIIWTVFSPLMVLPYLLPGGKEQAFALLRTEPTLVDGALGAIAETLAAYARAAVAAGADGLFYATNVATRALTTPEECRRFQRPWDLRILEAARDGRFNVVHVCGEQALFDELADYPTHAFSWAVVPGNPSLAEGHRRTGRAVLGGLPAKPTIATMTPSAMADRTRAAVREMSGRWLLIGPDCSINPDTPDDVLDAARAALTG